MLADTSRNAPATSGNPKLNGLLADYCAGTLSPPLHALVATHLMLRPDNRSYVAGLEALRASNALDRATPNEIHQRDARLRAIFDSSPRPANTLKPRDGSLPLPLQRLVGGDVEALRWRRILPGVKEYQLGDIGGGQEACFYLIRGGKKMPAHTHGGDEVTLVLKGAFADTSGIYGQGDICIADEAIDHTPTAVPGEDCLCFAVTDAPLKLTGPIGRYWNYFSKK